MAGKHLVIVGSGVVGRNLARALASRGDKVTVLSPRPVDLPALWCRCDVTTGEGLRDGLRGARAVVLAAAGRRGAAVEEVPVLGLRKLQRAAAHAGVERWLAIGPTGARHDAQARSLDAWARGMTLAGHKEPRPIELRLPVLFGRDDHLLAPWVAAARARKPLSVPSPEARFRPLWVQDAVRVALALLDGGLEPRPDGIELQGPQEWTLGGVADEVETRLGIGRRLLPELRRRREELARLPEQLAGRDDWDALGLDERRPLGDWLAGLEA